MPTADEVLFAVLWSPVTEGAGDVWVLGTASCSFKDDLEPFLVDFTEAVDDLFSAFWSIGDCAVTVSATSANEDKSPLVDVSNV